MLAVCGDGGFMMNSQELETAVRLKLNLVVLILEDNALRHDPLEAGGRQFRRLGPDLRQPRLRQVRRSLRREGIARRGDRRSWCRRWRRRSRAAACTSSPSRSTTPRTCRVLVDELRNRVPAGASAEQCMKIKRRRAERDGRAAALRDSKPLTIEELELDPPGPGEVLVRIKAAGLCHSDLSVINGDRPRPMPMALGHEAAGIVEEVGRRASTDLARRRSCGRACSCRPAAIAAVRRRPAGLVRAGRGGERRRHAALRRTAAAPRRRHAGATITWVSRASPSTPPSRAARWSRSIRSCRSTRRRCSAAPCSPASARWSTPRGCRPAPRSR